MGSAALSLPVNIPWKRLAFSYDMMDTQPDITALTDPTQFSSIDPPKWRSSISVFYHVADPATTSDQYPNGKILYLKLSCSITGYNPSEDMTALTGYQGSVLAQQQDNTENSILETIVGSGWANKYYPCLGSICQISVYPSQEDNDALQNPYQYPYIMDFAPKKREIMETANTSNEYLSGSSNDVNVQKGLTTTQSLEQDNILTGVSVSTSGKGMGSGGSLAVGVTGEWGTRQNNGTQSVDTTTTDSSRQMRETVSHSSTINQLYQIFNAYHLGLNRALFVMMPRPHTISPYTFGGSAPQGIVQQGGDSDPGEFNLISGIRMLEGIQDQFLVVYVPNDLKGICIKAVLDTGHTIPISDLTAVLGAQGAQAAQQSLNDIQTAGNDMNTAFDDFQSINGIDQANGLNYLTELYNWASNAWGLEQNGNYSVTAGYVLSDATKMINAYTDLTNDVPQAQNAVQSSLTAQQNNDPKIAELANGACNYVGMANYDVQQMLSAMQKLLTDTTTLSQDVDSKYDVFPGWILNLLPQVLAAVTKCAQDLSQAYADITTYWSDVYPANQGDEGSEFLLVTRRVVSTCATFNQDNTLTPSVTQTMINVPRQVGPIPEKPTLIKAVWTSVSYEQPLNSTPLSSIVGKDGSLDMARKTRINLVNQYNFRLQTIRRLMLNGFTSGRYRPRHFTQTEIFRRQLMATVARSPITLENLTKLKYINKDDAKIYQKAGARTLADIIRLRNSEKVKGLNQKPIQSCASILNNLQKTVTSMRTPKTTSNKVVKDAKGKQEPQKPQGKPNEPKANR